MYKGVFTAKFPRFLMFFQPLVY